MAKLDSLSEVVKEKYGTPAAPAGAVTSDDDDFIRFMKKKPVVSAPAAEQTAVKTETAAAPGDPPQKEATTTAAKEPIGYDGKPIYDLNQMAETVTGPLIDDPGTLTDLIFGFIKFIRSQFYPGFLFRIMFIEDERKDLEKILSKFIDIEKVGETDELIPLKTDMSTATEAEKVLLIKWRKFNKQLKNLNYTEKEESTFKNFIHSKVKNLSVDHLIAMFGPYIGLVAMEAGKIMPFYANRKQSLLNTYTNR